MPPNEEVVIGSEFQGYVRQVPHEVIVIGPRGAEPLTVLLGIVAQLLIKFH